MSTSASLLAATLAYGLSDQPASCGCVISDGLSSGHGVVGRGPGSEGPEAWHVQSHDGTRKVRSRKARVSTEAVAG